MTIYSPEFRVEALALVRRIGRRPAARQLGVSVNTLHRWEKPDRYERDKAKAAARPAMWPEIITELRAA